MKAQRIYETVLYADYLDAAEQFYVTVLGLECISKGENMVGFHCGDGYLLIFHPDRARLTNRGVPAHGAVGPGHIAFAVENVTIDDWRKHLMKCNVEIEMEVEWEFGGHSIYFRDPAGNSIELAPTTLWQRE